MYNLNQISHCLGISYQNFVLQNMPGRKQKVERTEEVVHLGPQVAEGEIVFGVAHIFASFNDTFVHVTDLSGK